MKTNYKIIFPLILILVVLNHCKEKDDPCLLYVDLEVDDDNPYGYPNGSKELQAQGYDGLQPYTYKWTNGIVVISDDYNSRIARIGETVSVEVTDNLGCIATASYANPCPCLNGGTCENGICQCPPGFSGDSCQNTVSTVPVSLTINSVKVTFIPPLYGGWREWDADSTKADLRLSINTNTSVGTTDGFYTSQIFPDVSVAPVTFQSDFPYLITNLDTFWTVNLFDDDSPDNPEHMGGVSFVPDNHFASADSITLQTGFPNTPRYTLHIKWNY